MSASEAAELRTHEKSDYSRIVFDYDSATKYTLSQDGQNITVTLDNNDPLSADSANQILSRVGTPAITKEGDSTRVTFTIKDNSSLRHFSTGSRIIVDVSGAQVEDSARAKFIASSKQETPSTEAVYYPDENGNTPAEAEETQEIKTTVESEKETAQLDNATSEVETTVETEAEITTPKNDLALDAPYVISMSFGAPASLTVFKDWRRLWIVTDQKDAKMPQITGPESAAFPTFEKLEIEGGSAFFADFGAEALSNFGIRGEGGGKDWRFVLAPDATSTMMSDFVITRTDNQKQLIWNADAPETSLSFTDPLSGLIFQVATVEQTGTYVAPAKSFPEFDVFESIAGLALTPKIDDLTLTVEDTRVILGKESGALAISSNIMPAPELDKSDEEIAEPENALENEETEVEVEAEAESGIEVEQEATSELLLNFAAWRNGNVRQLVDMERKVMANIALAENDQSRINDYLALAKIELSFGRGAEAIGALERAAEIAPSLIGTPDYNALLGAAAAMSYKYDRAFDAFKIPEFDESNEINAWRVVTLAGLEDWSQAGRDLPRDLSFIADYIPPVRQEVALTLAEVALREGRTEQSAALLDLVDVDRDVLTRAQKAAFTYLSGELFRQLGEENLSIKLWESLADSGDDYFRTKSIFALTQLLYQNEEIATDTAIERLEQLRYAWRGDDLETQILYRLGNLYIENNQPVQGLSLLRQAASNSADQTVVDQITTQMTQSFADIFLTDKLNDISPIEAVTLYEEFNELVPAGAQGDVLARKLANQLVEIDLLDRAGRLLKSQLQINSAGIPALELSIDLAKIQLMDRNPQAALNTTRQAENVYNALVKSVTDKDSPQLTTARTLYEDVLFYRAKALADDGDADKALALLATLPKNEQVLTLRADIAWTEQNWAQAASALGSLIDFKNIRAGAPLTEAQASLVLNWAIALNLADDATGLEAAKARFGPSMKASTRAQEFEIVTRPQRDIFMTDRDTINRIVSEVDIFDAFIKDQDLVN
tara:strand:+ start:692748 stop:695771 length:3024 start_codon:yes stop_codon:yes gene_type:complete